MKKKKSDEKINNAINPIDLIIEDKSSDKTDEKDNYKKIPTKYHKFLKGE